LAIYADEASSSIEVTSVFRRMHPRPI